MLINTQEKFSASTPIKEKVIKTFKFTLHKKEKINKVDKTWIG